MSRIGGHHSEIKIQNEDNGKTGRADSDLSGA